MEPIAPVGCPHGIFSHIISKNAGPAFHFKMSLRRPPQTLQCWVYFKKSKQSFICFFNSLGPPTTVNDINIIHNGTSGHLLSWSAPYSLQGIDTFYYINVIDESNGGETIVTTVSNTSYDKLELIACHNYVFSIIPSNNAGNGSESKLEYFYPGGMSVSVLHGIVAWFSFYHY